MNICLNFEVLKCVTFVIQSVYVGCRPADSMEYIQSQCIFRQLIMHDAPIIMGPSEKLGAPILCYYILLLSSIVFFFANSS
jgi:hypothetical protein